MKLALFAYVLAAALNIVPCPKSVQLEKSGTFRIKNTAINYDQKLDPKAQDAVNGFATSLMLACRGNFSTATSLSLKATADAGAIKGFAFVKDDAIVPEGYQIDITTKYVKVAASDANGIIYAIQTLKQMLPPSIYGTRIDEASKWELPCGTIKDEPRFGYRGMHLDCSRHFFSVAEVKKYLDVMAMYKLNRLHWHLTDDQGWRIEIKKYPRLTEVGAWRSGTMIGKDFDSSDGIRYGGFYTQEEILDVIDYAGRLGITIVPEIDLPGHMVTALAAYPQLGCTGGPYEPWVKWGIAKEVLCVGKESTMQFLEDVLAEVAALFPGEYIHIGGDECPKTEWEKCPECQAKIAELGLKSDSHAKAEEYLQNYVTARMQNFLATKGKKIIGWDEILEGQLAEGATVMSWRGTKGGIKAASMGFDVVMTPNTYCYFDYCQAKDKDSEPLSIGGFLPLEKVYGYEPYEGMTAGSEKHILGVQANLWTEYIATNEHLEYMLLPRMLALAEVQWCQPENKSYDRFLASLNALQYKVLSTLGYNYKEY